MHCSDWSCSNHAAVSTRLDRTIGCDRRHASLLELHTMAGVNKLPMQEMEDQSLVYPRLRNVKVISLGILATWSLVGPIDKPKHHGARRLRLLRGPDLGYTVELRQFTRAGFPRPPAKPVETSAAVKKPIPSGPERQTRVGDLTALKRPRRSV